MHERDDSYLHSKFKKKSRSFIRTVIILTSSLDAIISFYIKDALILEKDKYFQNRINNAY